MQCGAGRVLAAGWALGAGRWELCVDWSGHRVTRPMVNGQWSLAVRDGRFAWRSCPFLAPVPAVPALTQDCLVGRLHVCPHHRLEHIPSLHHNPSHLPVHTPAHSIQASEPNHTSPHIPQAEPPIICPLHPEFRLSPPAPRLRADALEQQPHIKTRDPHTSNRTPLSFLLSTSPLQPEIRSHPLHHRKATRDSRSSNKLRISIRRPSC